VNRYLTDDEAVEIVSRGANRSFAVTDRRVIDVTEGQTSSGRPTEIVQTSMFDTLAKAKISLKESIEEVNTFQRIVAAVLAILGALVVLGGLALDSGDLSGLLFVVGLALVAIGAFVWLTATEEVAGGIQIVLYHESPTGETKETYTLPEDQQETARAVIRMEGANNANTAALNPALAE
jgi:small-conductance mechanosensitive channel